MECYKIQAQYTAARRAKLINRIEFHQRELRFCFSLIISLFILTRATAKYKEHASQSILKMKGRVGLMKNRNCDWFSPKQV